MEKLNFMEWAECERDFIRRTEKDAEKIESMLKIADKRLNFIKSVAVNSNNVSFVAENYYEIIKELLSAFLLKNGLKSKNHQCLISYFYKKHHQYEFEARLILQMSYFRNRLNYYGEAIDRAFYDKHKEDFERIIDLIKGLIRENE